MNFSEAEPEATFTRDSADATPRYENFAGAFRAAREDAGSIAREAAPKLKHALRGAAHDIAYGAAFGACFAAAFGKEIIPSALRESLRRGARDGKNAAARTGEQPPAGPEILPPPLAI